MVRGGVLLGVFTVVALGALALTGPPGPAMAEPGSSCGARDVVRGPAPPAVDPSPSPPPRPRPPVGADPPNGALSQTVRLQVLPGPLRLSNDRAMVHLRPALDHAGRLVGTMERVDVVDARGSHEGWTLEWSVAEAWATTATGRVSLDPETVTVVPTPPEPIHGEPAGLTPGAACRGAGLLVDAEVGAGAGTHRISADVSVQLPPGESIDARAVVIQLSLS
jgi:hypothetical protein